MVKRITDSKTKPQRPGHTPQSVTTGRIETLFGALVLALGTFVLAAVSNPLEIAVYAGGPLLAVAGLIAAAMGARRRAVALIGFGLTTFALGSLLATHDFLFPPGIAVTIHLGIAISLLIVGVLQITARKRFYQTFFQNSRSRRQLK